jgi:hypothetical protein
LPAETEAAWNGDFNAEGTEDTESIEKRRDGEIKGG